MTQSVTRTRSSPQRLRYLAARRRGLSQAEARKEVGVSRSSAWRYDQVFAVEVAQRTAALEQYQARRDARRANEGVEVLEADDDTAQPQGPAVFPMPPGIDGRSTAKASAQEPLVGDGSYPAGLLERRQRAQSAGPRPLPDGHPSRNGRAASTVMGSMFDPESMGGTMSRPFLPEDPQTNILPGVV